MVCIQPLPLLRLSPISFTIKDAIKPLNPKIRVKMARPELIDRALQTATGSREVLVAILMIRQYREFVPKMPRSVERLLMRCSVLMVGNMFRFSIWHVRTFSVCRECITAVFNQTGSDCTGRW